MKVSYPLTTTQAEHLKYFSLYHCAINNAVSNDIYKMNLTELYNRLQRFNFFRGKKKIFGFTHNEIYSLNFFSVGYTGCTPLCSVIILELFNKLQKKIEAERLMRMN